MLSIPSISTRMRELFDCAAVLATFAMGTAAGDHGANTARSRISAKVNDRPKGSRVVP